MADINLTVGSGGKFGAFSITNPVTGQPYSGVTFSVPLVTSNTNPGAASFIIHSNGFPLGTPISVGSGNVGFSFHAVYTDPGDGLEHSEDFTVTKTFAVTGTANGATADVQFP